MSVSYCRWKLKEVRKRIIKSGAFLFGVTVLVIIGTYSRLTTTGLNTRQGTNNSYPLVWDVDEWLDSTSLTGDQLMQYVKWTNPSSCELIHDFGGVMFRNPSGIDGQKAICLDPQVAPNPENCLVYSFGINNEWSFDEQIEKYGCQVFAFDPSMWLLGPHDHNPKIHFYNWGLSDRDEIRLDKFWVLRSLSSIYNELTKRHGQKIIDYLKIDAESAEWIALPQIIESGMLSKVRQLGLEIHLNRAESMDKNRGYVKLLRSIEKMGFVRFDSKYNPWSRTNFTQLGLISVPFAFEIAWYNEKLFHNF
jgi:hypothetical protein